jgi:His-Xaa-Ser system protein HxsD
MQTYKETDTRIVDIVTTDIEIDLNLYGLVAIKKTCYKFTSECSIQIHNTSSGKVKISFAFASGVDSHKQEKMINDFHNELLDQDLREIIFKETESVRNLILAQAFSKTSLLDTE